MLMRGYLTIAMVALVGLVAILNMAQFDPQGAFVGRTNVRIIADSPNKQIVCADTGVCAPPSCKTGLNRVALFQNDIWRYQWASVPDRVQEQNIGSCCAPGSTLTFYADSDGETSLLDLTCSQGQWTGII